MKHIWNDIVIGIILVTLGLLFLALNFDLISGEIWQNLWKLWPLLLVWIGLQRLSRSWHKNN